MANDGGARESTHTRIARKTTPAKAPAKRAARAPVTQPKPPVITADEAVEMNTRQKETPTMPDPILDETGDVGPAKRTRKADPLLAAKRNLETARKAQAKAQKRVDAHGDIIAALEKANAEVAVAEEEFAAAVAAAVAAV